MAKVARTDPEKVLVVCFWVGVAEVVISFSSAAVVADVADVGVVVNSSIPPGPSEIEAVTTGGSSALLQLSDPYRDRMLSIS